MPTPAPAARDVERSEAGKNVVAIGAAHRVWSAGKRDKRLDENVAVGSSLKRTEGPSCPAEDSFEILFSRLAKPDSPVAETHPLSSLTRDDAFAAFCKVCCEIRTFGKLLEAAALQRRDACDRGIPKGLESGNVLHLAALDQAKTLA